jgi:hypothetical protein
MACVFVLAVLTSSCDTIQPLLAEQQLIELQFDSSAITSVPFFDVYTGTSDCNGDGLPDDDDMDGVPDTFLFCLDHDAFITPREARGFPWNYTVEITILPADGVLPELITSMQAAASSQFSLTPSDTRTSFGGIVQPQPPIRIGACEFSFFGGRIRSQVFGGFDGEPSVLASTTNPLAVLRPDPYGIKGMGLCSVSDPGPPVVDSISGSTYPFPIILDKGATVTVKAIRAIDPPDGVVDYLPSDGPGLSAVLTLGGTRLRVLGKDSADASSPDISFSYTSR